jgi:hypothetical protein
MYFLLKIVLSALLIAAVSQIAKRSTLFGALVASLPLTSLLAMIWLYQETNDAARIATFSSELFWLVLPSLLLFVVLPVLIRRGISFYPALAISAACTVVGYALVSLALHRSALKA